MRPRRHFSTIRITTSSRRPKQHLMQNNTCIHLGQNCDHITTCIHTCKEQTAAYHCNIKRLGHHGNEHVKEEDAGGDIVQAKEELSKAFDIAQFYIEYDQRDQPEQGPKQRKKRRIQSANTNHTDKTCFSQISTPIQRFVCLQLKITRRKKCVKKKRFG